MGAAIQPNWRAGQLRVSGMPTTGITQADAIVETWENGTAVAGPVPTTTKEEH